MTPCVATPIGSATALKLAFDGAAVTTWCVRLMISFLVKPGHAKALMDLCVVEQIFGTLPGGLEWHADALTRCGLYRLPAAVSPPALRLLAIAAPGDIGSNIPLEFLVEGSEVELHTLYIVPGLPLPET